MPYINNKDRQALVEGECIETTRPQSAGELNYCISYLIHNYIDMTELRYATINEVIGVLECAKLELYRQIAAPYEDVKKKENGAVSSLDSVITSYSIHYTKLYDQT